MVLVWYITDPLDIYIYIFIYLFICTYETCSQRSASIPKIGQPECQESWQDHPYLWHWLVGLKPFLAPCFIFFPPQ
jgi:hypothetical protein